MHLSRVVGSTLLSLSLLGCQGDGTLKADGGDSSTGPAPGCLLGVAVSCECTVGSGGTQDCLPSGVFGPCDCSAEQDCEIDESRECTCPSAEASTQACGGDGSWSGCACEKTNLAVTGGLQKGPFVLGSSVLISSLTALGEPTGDVYPTTTTNDLGDFSVQIANGGLVSIEGTGFYYNEVSGALSFAPITLRAYHEVTPQALTIYVNLVTHLAFGRVAFLVDQGSLMSDAVSQAEAELVTATQLGPPGFSSTAPGVEMNILGGDTDPNAYLLGLSSVLAQAAVIRAGEEGPVDASLQEILSLFSADLADDGFIEPSMQALIANAELALDPDAVIASLEQRLAQLGLATAIPDIHRIIDSDHDELVNADDNCPLHVNPGQEDDDRDGVGDACDCGNGTTEGDEQCDDGNGSETDSCLTTCTLASCSDGFVWDGVELCDDGNSTDDDACSNACRPATCGDWIVQAPEECDDGNFIETDACLESCIAAWCGDGHTRSGVESCDDGNEIETDGCLNNCELAWCLDGIVYEGVEECDDGNVIDDDACTNACTLPYCGDYIVQGVEECDDGNAAQTDSCLTSCVEATCGDGIVWQGVEDCDDANLDEEDLCSNDCQDSPYACMYEQTCPMCFEFGTALNPVSCNSPGSADDAWYQCSDDLDDTVNGDPQCALLLKAVYQCGADSPCPVPYELWCFLGGDNMIPGCVGHPPPDACQVELEAWQLACP